MLITRIRKTGENKVRATVTFRSINAYAARAVRASRGINQRVNSPPGHLPSPPWESLVDRHVVVLELRPTE